MYDLFKFLVNKKPVEDFESFRRYMLNLEIRAGCQSIEKKKKSVGDFTNNFDAFKKLSVIEFKTNLSQKT